MGFTRYWIRPQELDATRFADFSAECNFECETLGIPLAEALFSADVVTFQGNPGWETFRIPRVSTGRLDEGGIFEFCKTQHRPYDKAVERCLNLLKKHFPEVEIPDPS